MRTLSKEHPQDTSTHYLHIIYSLSTHYPGHPQRYRRDGSKQRGVPHQEQPGQHHHRAVRTHDRGPRREGRAHFG